MQGHASGHSTAYKSDELLEQGIRLIQWPAYSPDLDPIEKEWDWMKDWIDDHYPSKLNYGDVLIRWHGMLYQIASYKNKSI